MARYRRQLDDGATAVEYAVMVALIAALIVLVVLYLGQQTKSGFCGTQTAMSDGGIAPHDPGAADDCT
jgi:pilus assembly protein Flp/PilA